MGVRGFLISWAIRRATSRHAAFLWAEAIVVCSLTFVVVRGVQLEWRNEPVTG